MLKIVPPSYRLAANSEKERLCNGCGPQSWKVDIVPDCILGLDISEACNVHDWMYHHGPNNEHHRKYADRCFLWNMNHLIKVNPDAKTPVRYIMALWYYRGVRKFGARAFYG